MKLVKIEDVLKNNLCIGCGICTNFSDNSKIKYDENGFLKVNNYKHVSNEIDEKTLVKEVCPGVKTYTYANDKDYVWGDFKKLYLGYSLDDEIRFKGSSGGTITQTLIYLLENKIVDYVIHIEQDESNVFSNKVKITNNIEDVLSNTGSKYCPSSPLNEVLKNIDYNLKYAFVGRPCDIVALRNYEKINPSIAKSIIYKISFFCAGAPSINGTLEILKKFSLKKEDVVRFRYRGNGWPGFTTAITKNKDEFKMPYDESWGKILNKYLHKRCKICPDGVGMEADLVFGDGWECDEKGYPLFKEGEGKSLVLIRNSNGEKLINNIQKDSKIKLENFNYKNLKFVQPYQYERRSTLRYRILALKLFNRKLPVYEVSIKKASKDQKIEKKIKTFLGTLKRAFKNKI